MSGLERNRCRAASAADVPALANALAGAFDGYSLTEWVVRGDARRDERRRLYFRSFLEEGLAYGEVRCHVGGEACAIWYPPGSWRVGLLSFVRLAPRLARICGVARLPSRAAGLRALAAEHPPEAHRYLEVIGTAPSAQGRGIGSTLLEDGLARAEEEGVPTTLITSSPRAIPLYERHGFHVSRSFEVPGGPPVWSMRRDALAS